MPFTFSHPALVLPLSYFSKRWFSLTGLVIGSLTPDFEYFLRMRIKSIYSHTWSGVFWFDLPFGLLLAYLFHNLVRNSLFEHLPRFLKSRLYSFQTFNWNVYFLKNWFIVIVSIIIGAGSHILWDSFTHERGYFVEIIPLLSQRLNYFGIEVPIFKIVQHTSTFIGGLIIAYTIFQLPINTINKAKSNYKYWTILFTLTLLITLIRIMNRQQWKEIGNCIVTFIAAGLISLVITPLLIRSKIK